MAKQQLSVYLYLAPALIILAFVVVYPWLWSLTMSFTRWKLSSGKAPAFIGLDNYIHVLNDAKFLLALNNSLLFMIISVCTQLLCGLTLALLLNRRLPIRRVLMVGILLPYMLTPAMVGLVWKILLHGSWGVINYYIHQLGMPGVDWLGHPSTTMFTLSLIATWLHTPWVALMLFSGLQAVSEELTEAALVDGANPRQIFLHVTLPSIRPLIWIVIMFRVVFSFREFDVIYSLFGSGGPANSAMVLGVYLYQKFSGSWDIGRSSAVSFIMLAITIVLSLPTMLQKGGDEA